MNSVWFVNWSLYDMTHLSKVKVFYTKKEALDFASLKSRFAITERSYFPDGSAVPYDKLLVIRADRLSNRDLLMLKAYTNLEAEQIEEIRKKGLVE